MQQAEVGVGPLTGFKRHKRYEKIEIASRRVKFTACCGADQIQPLHVVLFAQSGNFGAVLFDEWQHGRLALYPTTPGRPWMCLLSQLSWRTTLNSGPEGRQVIAPGVSRGFAWKQESSKPRRGGTMSNASRRQQAWIYKCSADNGYSWLDDGYFDRKGIERDFGGEEWIRSPQSWNNLAALKSGDLIFCHQGHGAFRAIVGMTIAASGGYADPNGQ